MQYALISYDLQLILALMASRGPLGQRPRDERLIHVGTSAWRGLGWGTTSETRRARPASAPMSRGS